MRSKVEKDDIVILTVKMTSQVNYEIKSQNYIIMRSKV